MPFSWQASRTVRVKVLGGSPWILSMVMSFPPAEEAVELGEAALPALGVAAEARQIDERAVDQGELGPIADRAEGELDRGLVTAHAVEAVVGMVSPGEDQALGPSDLAIDARLGEGRAVRLVAMHAPAAAGARVQLALIEPKAGRAHPLHELPGI